MTTFNGGPGDNWFKAGGGDDYLDGGAGDDTLIGGNGNNTILGGFGDDALKAGTGNDLLKGDDGSTALELRGDAYLADGKVEQAREEYGRALAALDVDAPARRRVELKMQEAGGDVAAPAESI